MDWNPDAKMDHRRQPVAQDLKDRLQHRTLTAFLQHNGYTISLYRD